MSPVEIGIAVFVVMLTMIMIGIPVFISMFACGFVGFILVDGMSMANTQFTTALFSLSATYKFAVLPLFMLMGVLAGESGIADGLFVSAKKWTGRIRGGLMMGTVFANLIFGACCGQSTAANAVFGKVAFPALKKDGYDESFALGGITATGALSSLVPPSLGVIMFCILTEYSIGAALTAIIVPGLLTAVVYCLVIVMTARLRPRKIPPVTEADRNVTLLDRMRSLKLMVPIIGLMLVIVLGSYLGWFAPTVAGAIGSFAVIVYALLTRMRPRKLALNIIDAAKMNALVFPMIIGGMMFSRFVTVCGLADAFASFITNLHMNRFGVVLVLMLIYIILGCIMDVMSIIIITVPIVTPAMVALGFNPYVMCVLIIFVCEIAGLTPPIGMNVFATATVLRTSPSKVFKGVMPFFVADCLMVLLIIFVPQLTTWLPNAIGKM